MLKPAFHRWRFKIVRTVVSNTVSKLSGGAFALQTIYISKLSIAKSSNPEPIETLISYMLQLHQQSLLAQDKRVLS